MTKYVTSSKHPLAAAKAYIALAGATATALLGVFAADTDIGKVLVAISVVATALATYQFPNADVLEGQGEYDDDGFDPEATDPEGTPVVPHTPEYEDGWDEALPIEEYEGRHEAP